MEDGVNRSSDDPARGGKGRAPASRKGGFPADAAADRSGRQGGDGTMRLCGISQTAGRTIAASASTRAARARNGRTTKTSPTHPQIVEAGTPVKSSRQDMALQAASRTRTNPAEFSISAKPYGFRPYLPK